MDRVRAVEKRQPRPGSCQLGWRVQRQRVERSIARPAQREQRHRDHSGEILMPYLTKIHEVGGTSIIELLLQRELAPGTVLDTDGLTTPYVVVESVKFI